MRLFGGLYDKVLQWSRHRHASWFLGGLSFAESSFFPIPPDVLLIPMALARRDRGYALALLTTVTSVLGGLLGYAIGFYALEWAEPLLRSHGFWERYLQVQVWFASWGFLAVLVAGFSPVPYKIFTIAAGGAGLFLPVFVAASIVGRGARFFLVAGLVVAGGEKAEAAIRRHVETLGWLVVVAAIAALILTR